MGDGGEWGSLSPSPDFSKLRQDPRNVLESRILEVLCTGIWKGKETVSGEMILEDFPFRWPQESMNEMIQFNHIY